MDSHGAAVVVRFGRFAPASSLAAEGCCFRRCLQPSHPSRLHPVRRRTGIRASGIAVAARGRVRRSVPGRERPSSSRSAGQCRPCASARRRCDLRDARRADPLPVLSLRSAVVWNSRLSTTNARPARRRSCRRRRHQRTGTAASRPAKADRGTRSRTLARNNPNLTSASWASDSGVVPVIVVVAFDIDLDPRGNRRSASCSAR